MAEHDGVMDDVRTPWHLLGLACVIGIVILVGGSILLALTGCGASGSAKGGAASITRTSEKPVTSKTTIDTDQNLTPEFIKALRAHHNLDPAPAKRKYVGGDE